MGESSLFIGIIVVCPLLFSKQASAVAGASGSAADNAANAVRSAAAINGPNASTDQVDSTPFYLDNSSGPSFLQGTSDPAGYVVDQVNDGSLLKVVVPIPASDQRVAVTESMQAAPVTSEPEQEQSQGQIETENDVAAKTIDAFKTGVSNPEVAEGLEKVSSIFDGVAKTFGISERLERIEALPTLGQKIAGGVGEIVDMVATDEYGATVGLAAGLIAAAAGAELGLATGLVALAPAIGIGVGAYAAYRFADGYSKTIRELTLPETAQPRNEK